MKNEIYMENEIYMNSMEIFQISQKIKYEKIYFFRTLAKKPDAINPWPLGGKLVPPCIPYIANAT